MATISMDRISAARTGSRALSRLATAVAAGSLALAAAGCSAPRTWPSDGDPSSISVDTPPLPQVVIASLNYAHTEIAPNTPLVYNLPQEMNIAAWGTFERGLAPGKPMCPGDTHVWTVRKVRIDGSKAQVDIEFPSRDGFYQSVTVHLNGATGGFDYKPAYLQYWKVPVKDPVCQQPVEVVERLCGADAAAKLRKEREAAAPAGAPGSAAPSANAAPRGVPSAAGEEPSK